MDHLLSLITYLPLAGAVVVLALPRSQPGLARAAALVATLPSLVLGVWLFGHFDRSSAAMQMVERHVWIPAFNVEYLVGVDGLSVSMLLLTVLLAPLCVVASTGIDRGVGGYFALLLLLETTMLGVFTALDFFLFFVFWELALLPLYFLIGIWGGERREHAALEFFLYMLLGSVLVLVAMLALYFAGDPHTFDMMVLAGNAPTYARGFQAWVWLVLFLGFATRIPVFPFHTWLPDVQAQAPAPVSVLLTAVLPKMGVYAILRICYPILPQATLQYAYYAIGALGCWTIVYGALCAMAQKDVKRLVAYWSISQMGYVMLGMATLTPQGMEGAALQMFNHGVVAAMLVVMTGVVYDRTRHPGIDAAGGLASVMPMATGFAVIAFFAALGAPGFSFFPAQLLVLLGAWQNFPVFAIVGAGAAVLTAGYLLWTLQRVWLGPLSPQHAAIADLSWREIAVLLPLAALVLLLGLHPHALLDLVGPTLIAIGETVRGAAPVVVQAAG